MDTGSGLFPLLTLLFSSCGHGKHGAFSASFFQPTGFAQFPSKIFKLLPCQRAACENHQTKFLTMPLQMQASWQLSDFKQLLEKTSVFVPSSCYRDRKKTSFRSGVKGTNQVPNRCQVTCLTDFSVKLIASYKSHKILSGADIKRLNLLIQWRPSIRVKLLFALPPELQLWICLR